MTLRMVKHQAVFGTLLFLLSFAYCILMFAVADLIIVWGLADPKTDTFLNLFMAGIFASVGMCMWSFVWAGRITDPYYILVRVPLAVVWPLYAYVLGVIVNSTWVFPAAGVALIYLVAALVVGFASLFKMIMVSP